MQLPFPHALVANEDEGVGTVPNRYYFWGWCSIYFLEHFAKNIAIFKSGIVPKALEVNGFRFFFYSGDGDEPCHVHVQKGAGDGKIWLEPEVKEEYLADFKGQEKRDIRRIVKENRT